MKKITACILALALCLSLAACGGTELPAETANTSHAFETARATYEKIGEAYELVDLMSKLHF